MVVCATAPFLVALDMAPAIAASSGKNWVGSGRRDRRPSCSVVAVVDSNADPKGIAFPIPGNDDAIRAIHLYCDMVSAAVLDGLAGAVQSSGVDIGALEEVPVEVLPEAPVEAPAEQPAAE